MREHLPLQHAAEIGARGRSSDEELRKIAPFNTQATGLLLSRGDISTSPAGEKMGSAQFTSPRRIEHARAESLLLDEPHDIFGVPLVARLDHDLELSTFGRNVEEHATMGDLENIGAVQ